MPELLNTSSSVLAQADELTYALFEEDKVDEKLITHSQFDDSDQKEARAQPYKRQIVWRNVIAMLMIHGLAVCGIFALPHITTGTTYFLMAILMLGTLGIQAGGHRLWAHKTYKANFGLRLFLSLCHVLALQNDIYEWARDHRAHHKFSDTDADPHNASRGFFFSHVGWLLVKKHPEVIRRGKTIGLSDLEKDPIVMFQKRFYIPMVLLIWGFLPAAIPVYFWGESLWYSITVCVFFRYAYQLNLTWCVNSWSHMYGYRPYDSRIAPVESTIRHLLMGEGFHNYHHAFPWDYSASELGAFDVFNPATAAIDFFHWMGWAWDLKKASPALVESKMKSKGGDEYSYKNATSFYEWSTGILAFLSPILCTRWILMFILAH